MTLISRAQEIRSETEKNANTAERVGSLLEDIVSELAIGKAYFGNGSTPVDIELDQDTNVKLTKTDLLFTASKELNITFGPDVFIVSEGTYKVTASISFEGYSGGNYHLMIFKNAQKVCECNPHVEVNNNRTTNLVSIDVVDCIDGDFIDVYVKNSGNSKDIGIINAKLIVEKIPFA